MLLKVTSNDPRVKRTRQMLQTALYELLHENEFQDVTVQDITARAGVNRATFYAHFEDKFALMDYSLRESFQEMLDTRLPPTPTFTPENLRLLILATCEFFSTFVDHCAPNRRLEGQVMMITQIQKHLQSMLMEWLHRSPPDVVPANTTTQAMASVISWSIFGTAFRWSQETKRIPAAQLTDQILPLVIGAARSA